MAQQNISRIRRDRWFSRLGRVFSWAGLIFWAMIGLVGLGKVLSGEAADSIDHVMIWVCAGLAGLHLWLLCRAYRIKGLLRDFRLYCAVFAREPDKSIPELAAALNLSPEKAEQRLNAMCRRGYFNGYVDHQRQRMLFHTGQAQQGVLVAYCPGCGARNTLEKNGDACLYCGSPLQI